MLLFIGVEILDSSHKKSDNISPIGLYFDVADIWCCMGGDIQAKGVRPQSVFQLFKIRRRWQLVN